MLSTPLTSSSIENLVQRSIINNISATGIVDDDLELMELEEANNSDKKIGVKVLKSTK